MAQEPARAPAREPAHTKESGGKVPVGLVLSELATLFIGKNEQELSRMVYEGTLAQHFERIDFDSHPILYSTKPAEGPPTDEEFEHFLRGRN